MNTPTTYAAHDLTDDESNDVRVITTDGDIVHYEEHGPHYTTAWDHFTQVITELDDGHIAQLIVDDLLTAEHDPKRHGPTALPARQYA